MDRPWDEHGWCLCGLKPSHGRFSLCPDQVMDADGKVHALDTCRYCGKHGWITGARIAPQIPEGKNG